MTQSVKKLSTQFAVTLCVTFVLGFAIGFATYPVLFRGPNVQATSRPAGDEEAPPAIETATAPQPAEGDSTGPLAMVEAVEERRAIAPAVSETAEPAEDLWPGRFLFVSVRGASLDAATRGWLREIRPGGVILLGHNIESKEQTTALVREIKEAVGMGTGISDLPLIAIDQEGGRVNRLRLESAPSARELGGTGDVDIAIDTGRYYAREARERGIGVVFAPVLDIYQPGAQAALDSRAFGDTPAVVTAMGLAFADGVMDGGAIPVAKHYPGHGGARQDSHEMLAVLEKDIGELAVEMNPFTQAALWGLPGIMVGHIAVPALDTAHPDRPASLSPVLVRNLLRESRQYGGVIITDDLAMGAITQARTLPQAAVEALWAGCDAVILSDPNPEVVRAVCEAIEAAVEAGEGGGPALSREELERSRQRLEQWQAWLRDPQQLIDRPLPERRETPQLAQKPDDDGEALEETAEPAGGGESAGPERRAQGGRVRIEHVVQPGEMLSRLAVDYGVTQREVMEWNNLADPNLRIDQRLVLYVPEDRAQDRRSASNQGANDQAESAEGPREDAGAGRTRRIEHRVVAGDTLTRIANRYGVRQQDIKAWNDMQDDTVRLDQRLVVYVPAE